jgi:hypothetical protein
MTRVASLSQKGHFIILGALLGRVQQSLFRALKFSTLYGSNLH